MTFVILTGGIDLSVGSVLALCGVALGMTVQGGAPFFLHLAMAFPLGVLAAWATLWLQRMREEAAGPRQVTSLGPKPPARRVGTRRAVPAAAGVAVILIV